MNYYVNEYSLRGQFDNEYDFFDSLRKYTLPVLKKIKAEDGSVIWKKDSLWMCKISGNLTLEKMRPHRNERDPEITRLKMSLMELYCRPVLWSEEEKSSEITFEYGFDESYRNYFTHQNCFTEAWKSEGRIISFLHTAYKTSPLPLIAFIDGKRYDSELDNIWSESWWNREPEIRKWMINGKYLVEIRGKEFEYHPPHFHVSCSEYQAVFHLYTGEFYTGSKDGIPRDFLSDIKKWYEENKTELEQAWNLLHPSITYNN